MVLLKLKNTRGSHNFFWFYLIGPAILETMIESPPVASCECVCEPYASITNY